MCGLHTSTQALTWLPETEEQNPGPDQSPQHLHHRAVTDVQPRQTAEREQVLTPQPPDPNRQTHTPMDPSQAYLAKKSSISYVQDSDFKLKILSMISPGWQMPHCLALLLSLLAWHSVPPTAAGGGGRGSQTRHQPSSPCPSLRGPSSQSQRTSDHQVEYSRRSYQVLHFQTYPQPCLSTRNMRNFK